MECPITTQLSSPRTDALKLLHSQPCLLSSQLCNNPGQLIKPAAWSPASSCSNPRSWIEYWWTHKGHTTDRCSFLSESKTEKTSPQRLFLSGKLVGFFSSSLFSLVFSYPVTYTGLWILLISTILCCSPSLLSCVDCERKPSHSSYLSISRSALSPLSVLTPSFPLSLSLTAEVCSAPPVLIGLL